MAMTAPVAAAIQDLTYVSQVKEVDGELKRGFKVFVGGGTSIMPKLAKPLYDFLPEEDYLRLALAIWTVFEKADSLRKNRINDTTGAVAEGPNGQIVVISGGHPSPGLMLSDTSRSRSMSAWRPRPVRMRYRIRSSQLVPSRHGVHCPHDSWA